METVESICNVLARLKLLEVDEVRSLRARWREQAGARADQVADFARWLVKNGRVTEFQLDMLTRGHGEQLFFDDYKLLERIGRGRMAGVYRAVHESGQIVALKVLPPSRSKDPQLLGRFLREARLATQLDHDNVVRTFHRAKSKEGVHYIVMEYLDGDTLEEVLQRRKRLPCPEAVFVMLQVLQGLEHLDEKSLVHRDMKPANIMLVPASAPGATDNVFRSTPKILDIGLSRALFDEGAADEEAAAGELTREGALLGTTTYMAPEQARDARRVDIRADIYSLGCILYEMLAGQPPFVDAQPVRQLKRHALEEPRPLADHVAGIPEAVESIVQKMLAKDPMLRYLTPGGVIKDLRALKMEPAVAVQPARPLRSFMTWLETKRTEDSDAPTQTTGVAVPIPVAPAEPAKKPPEPAPTPVPVGGVEPKPIFKAVPLPIPVPAASPPPPAAAPPPVVPTPVAPAPAPAPAASAPAATKSTADGTTPPPAKNELAAIWQSIRSLLSRLSLREWICVAAGAGVVVVLQFLWGLLRRALG